MSIKFKLALLTLPFLLLSHYLAYFPHEFAHSFSAWALGYKANPWLLDFGGTSWSNLLLLAHVDENVNYQSIFSAGHPLYVSLIAFAGPGLANGLLFSLSFFLLKVKKIRLKPYLFYFIFYFNLMNLGNLYDYVPIRTFAPSGDVYNFVTGLHVSPWWIYATAGYLVAFLICQFFTRTLKSVAINLQFDSTTAQGLLTSLCVCVLFGFFGGFSYVYFMGLGSAIDAVTYFLSASSFLAIPGLIVALWPKNKFSETLHK